MEIIEIINMPLVIDNRHESCFRSYHILEYVKKQIEIKYPKDTTLIDIIEIMGRCNLEVGKQLKNDSIKEKPSFDGADFFDGEDIEGRR